MLDGPTLTTQVPMSTAAGSTGTLGVTTSDGKDSSSATPRGTPSTSPEHADAGKLVDSSPEHAGTKSEG